MIYLLGGSSLRHQIRIRMKVLRTEQVERSGCGLDKGLASSGTLQTEIWLSYSISVVLYNTSCAEHATKY